MAKVILSGYIEVPDSDLEAVTDELPIHVRLTREEEGCVVFDVHQDGANKNRFNVYEEFSSQDAFERHQQRIMNSKWGQITTAVSRHYEIKQEADD